MAVGRQSFIDFKRFLFLLLPSFASCPPLNPTSRWMSGIDWVSIGYWLAQGWTNRNPLPNQEQLLIQIWPYPNCEGGAVCLPLSRRVALPVLNLVSAHREFHQGRGGSSLYLPKRLKIVRPWRLSPLACACTYYYRKGRLEFKSALWIGEEPILDPRRAVKSPF